MMACSLDADCPGRSVCFSANRTQWVKQFYGDFASFCDCPRSGLHVGYPHCNIKGPGYGAELAIRAIQLVIIGVMIFIGSWDLFRLKRISQLSMDKSIVQTSVFVLVANMFHVSAIAFTLSCNHPDTPQVLIVGFKICSRATELLVFTVFATLFSFLSHANVAILWINLVTTSKNLKLTRIATGHRLKRGLIILQTLYFVILSSAVGLLQLDIALIATIPYAFILMVGYYLGGAALAGVLSESLTLTSGTNDPNRSSLYRSLRRVRSITRVMVVLFLAEIISLVLTGLFLVSTFGIQYEYDFVDRPVASFFIADQVIMILLNFVVITYVHVSVNATVAGFSQRSGSMDIPRTPLHVAQGKPNNQQQVKPESVQETALVVDENAEHV